MSTTASIIVVLVALLALAYFIIGHLRVRKLKMETLRYTLRKEFAQEVMEHYKGDSFANSYPAWIAKKEHKDVLDKLKKNETKVKFNLAIYLPTVIKEQCELLKEEAELFHIISKLEAKA